MSSLISVVIPVYNAERTIARCIESVLSQTHSELEVICVIDGGADRSADILHDYAERDSRLRVIEQEGRGPATARNTGLDAATGGYIGFVDADDYISPRMYARLLAAIQDGCELANCGHIKFFPDGTEKIAAPEPEGPFVSDSAQRLGQLIARTPDFIWDKLFDARIVQGEEIRFPDGRVYGEDTVFLLQYLRFVTKAAFVAEPFYHYNAHSEGSITNTISDSWYDIFENLKDILYDYREHLDKADFAIIIPFLEELCIRYYDRRANAMLRYSDKGFQLRYVTYAFAFLTHNFPDWKERMKNMPGIVFPRVKTSLPLMRLYIFAPEILKARLARGRSL